VFRSADSVTLPNLIEASHDAQQTATLSRSIFFILSFSLIANCRCSSSTLACRRCDSAIKGVCRLFTIANSFFNWQFSSCIASFRRSPSFPVWNVRTTKDFLNSNPKSANSSCGFCLHASKQQIQASIKPL